MIRNIVITICTIFLFALMAWTTIAAPSESNQEPLMQVQVQYELPYPGILPDNPLYPLKTLRDRIVSFFITDARKQAQFDLLQSDKRLAAGEYLLNGSKPNDTLVSQTLSKSANYFSDAITNIAVAKKQGELVNDFLNTLHDASKKHQQVLLQMAHVTQGQLHTDIEGDFVHMQGFENQVEKLIKQH